MLYAFYTTRITWHLIDIVQKATRASCSSMWWISLQKPILIQIQLHKRILCADDQVLKKCAKKSCFEKTCFECRLAPTINFINAKFSPHWYLVNSACLKESFRGPLRTACHKSSLCIISDCRYATSELMRRAFATSRHLCLHPIYGRKIIIMIICFAKDTTSQTKLCYLGAIRKPSDNIT